MISYVWPVVLIICSNVLYQVCSKATPEKIDPLASLTVTYSMGMIASAVLYFVLNRDGNLLREYSHLNWAPFVFGIALVGLEVGFIYAYRAGWAVSTISTVQSAFLAVVLIFVGALLYRESITLNKVLGVAICLVGLYFINKN